MGNLTDDMTRLRGEVDALRSDRGALMAALSLGVNDLASSVSAMRADFGAAHAAMAEEARNSRAAFVSTMSGEVNAFLADCRKARGEMAVEGSERRAAFCAGMQKYVAGMCMETADDLAGARLAWSGRGSRIRRERRSPKEHRAVEAPRSDGKSLSATSPGRRKKVNGADRSGAPHSVKKLATKSKRTKRLSK